MALEPLETAEGSDFPFCRQLSVFLENRLGQLLRLTRLFERGHVRILGLSVEGATDCAIVRMLVDDPDTAFRMLSDANFPATETELLVVELPEGSRGIMSVCSALITGEVNLNYTYALLPHETRGACVALQVDNTQAAAAVLASKRFHVLDHSEL